MATIKVILEKGEDELAAEHSLLKALKLHSSGVIHDGDHFEDPAMEHVVDRMQELFSRTYSDMVREINSLLDEEFSNGS